MDNCFDKYTQYLRNTVVPQLTNDFYGITETKSKPEPLKGFDYKTQIGNEFSNKPPEYNTFSFIPLIAFLVPLKKSSCYHRP